MYATAIGDHLTIMSDVPFPQPSDTVLISSLTSLVHRFRASTKECFGHLIMIIGQMSHRNKTCWSALKMLSPFWTSWLESHLSFATGLYHIRIRRACVNVVTDDILSVKLSRTSHFFFSSYIKCLIVRTERQVVQCRAFVTFGS